MTARSITPAGICPPFGRYSHAREVPAHWRTLVLSGQLGVDREDNAPASAGAQADLCFFNIGEILKAGDMGPGDIIRVTGYLTDIADRVAYMAARDRFLADVPEACLPASTLLVVAGLARADLKVEVEVIAAAP